MAEKEVFIFTDPVVQPDREKMIPVLGERIRLWDELMAHIDSAYANPEKVWRYYKDGGQWLFRMLHKKKTVFWSVIVDDAFRVTFYFGGKSEPLVMGSDIPQALKDEFRAGKSYGAIKALSVKVMEQNDLDVVYRLILLKTSIK